MLIPGERHYSRQREAVANAEDLIRVSQKITKGKTNPFRLW